MNLLKTFFDITLIQAKPQDVPFSYPLLLITAITSIISYIVAMEPVRNELMARLGEEISIAQIAVAEHLFFAATVFVILRLRQHTERFVQMLTAMFGVNTIMQLIMWPATEWLLLKQETPLPTLLMIALRIWLLIAYANIFKETLETRFGVGILFTIGSLSVAALLTFFVARNFAA